MNPEGTAEKWYRVEMVANGKHGVGMPVEVTETEVLCRAAEIVERDGEPSLGGLWMPVVKWLQSKARGEQ